MKKKEKKFKVEIYVGNYSSKIVNNAELVDWFVVKAKTRNEVMKFLEQHNFKIEELEYEDDT